MARQTPETREPSEQTPQYDAFITYSHVDTRRAARAQRFLEGYRLPPEPHRPRRRLKVYLDQTDIRAGSLTEELKIALANSQALVVCCSPSAAASSWVTAEINEFSTINAGNPIVALLLSGDPAEAIPQPLRDLELRFSDLRHGWWFGILRPKAREELVRLIAVIAALDLRTLIPWHRRRMRQRLATFVCTGFLVLTATLLYPISLWEKLAVLPRHPILPEFVYGEVSGNDLVLVSRHRGVGGQGGRDYGQTHSSALDPKSDPKRTEKYHLNRRLVNWRVADPNLLERATTMIKLVSSNDIWIGEPIPGSFVIVQLDEARIPEDEYSDPPRGSSLVYVYHNQQTRSARADGLFPEWQWGNRVEAHFIPPDGLPIAWVGTDIWIGNRQRSDGGPGGLWHSLNIGETWSAETGFKSVNSILLDPSTPGRVLVAEGPGDVNPNLIAPRYQARIIERKPGDETWFSFSGPPYGSSSQIDLCGFLPDGTLVVRVDQAVYRLHKRSFLSRFLNPT